MVYRKKYTRRRYRRGYRKKNPFVSKAAKYAGMAYTAYKGVKYLKGLVNSEKGMLDFNANTTYSSTGSVISLNNIAQGDTVSSRQGNSILVKGIFGRMLFTQNSSATNTFVRCVIFCNKQQLSDSTPAVDDVLESVSVKSNLNISHKGQYSVLRDFTIRLDSANNTSAARKINIPLNMHLRYNGTAATDWQKNGLFMILLSNEATNVPTVDWNLRVSWHDN